MGLRGREASDQRTGKTGFAKYIIPKRNRRACKARLPVWYAICMSQIAVRLSEAELRQLDAVVREAGFRTRAEAVRAGIHMLSREAREQRISDSYARAYARAPLSEDETRSLDAAAALAAQLSR
jgi:Arc/MetJ-type ribon-helix-helix transcriptional regulator